MIYGIGTDIVAIERMVKMHDRHGDKLARRLLAPGELDEYAGAAEKGVFLAKRFAAKEALAKALGTGLRAPVALPAMRVTHDSLGRPGMAFSPGLQDWLTRRGIGRVHLSLSDERRYAVAFVVLEGQA